MCLFKMLQSRLLATLFALESPEKRRGEGGVEHFSFFPRQRFRIIGSGARRQLQAERNNNSYQAREGRERKKERNGGKLLL